MAEPSLEEIFTHATRTRDSRFWENIAAQIQNSDPANPGDREFLAEIAAHLREHIEDTEIPFKDAYRVMTRKISPRLREEQTLKGLKLYVFGLTALSFGVPALLSLASLAFTLATVALQSDPAKYAETIGAFILSGGIAALSGRKAVQAFRSLRKFKKAEERNPAMIEMADIRGGNADKMRDVYLLAKKKLETRATGKSGAGAAGRNPPGPSAMWGLSPQFSSSLRL